MADTIPVEKDPRVPMWMRFGWKEINKLGKRRILWNSHYLSWHFDLKLLNSYTIISVCRSWYIATDWRHKGSSKNTHDERATDSLTKLAWTCCHRIYRKMYRSLQQTTASFSQSSTMVTNPTVTVDFLVSFLDLVMSFTEFCINLHTENVCRNSVVSNQNATKGAVPGTVVDDVSNLSKRNWRRQRRTQLKETTENYWPSMKKDVEKMGN
jgi:hypothetical protein